MAKMKVLLPQFGMGMQDAEIIRWRKQIGEKVDIGEPLVDIEAAKTTVEVPSPGSGTLTEILVPEGESADVRAHIATLEL